MKKLIRNMYIKSALTIGLVLLIGSFLIISFNMLKLYELVKKIIFFTAIAEIAPVIQLIYTLFNCRKGIEKYVKESIYTEELLDREFENSQKIGETYFGYTHIFFVNLRSVCIVPISSFKELDIKKVSANSRGSFRYYYKMYARCDETHVYILDFLTRKSAESAVRSITLRNPDVRVIYPM